MERRKKVVTNEMGLSALPVAETALFCPRSRKVRNTVLLPSHAEIEVYKNTVQDVVCSTRGRLSHQSHCWLTEKSIRKRAMSGWLTDYSGEFSCPISNLAWNLKKLCHLSGNTIMLLLPFLL